MLFRRGIPFPVQSDTKVSTEVNPIERVEGTQSLSQEATFDYERKLPPEISSLQVDVVEKDIIINPQPTNPALIEHIRNLGIIAERPILKRLVADQLDFTNKFSSQAKQYGLFPQSIPPHQRGFGNPERKSEYPKDEQDWAKRNQMNFLDKFFHWLNSIIGE